MTKNLAQAVLKVMKAVEGIDKNLSVGTGKSSYKGVADKDVKLAVGRAMQENGLTILPIGVEPTITVSRWEQEENWNGNKQIKQKQSVFTEVKTKYLLLHDSGESIEIVGYGHGVDSGDKSAGKATTYALKNALLYTFMVPTGSIDDTDNTHSDQQATPTPSATKKASIKQRNLVSKLITQKGRNELKLLEHYGVNSLAELTSSDASSAIEMLNSLPNATLH